MHWLLCTQTHSKTKYTHDWRRSLSVASCGGRLTLWTFFSSASCGGTSQCSDHKMIPEGKKKPERLTCDTLRISSAKGQRSCLHSRQILFSVDTLDTDSSSFPRPWSTMGKILPIMTGWSASHSARDPASGEKTVTSALQETNPTWQTDWRPAQYRWCT